MPSPAIQFLKRLPGIFKRGEDTGIRLDGMVKESLKTVHAVYESGVFRPLEKVELPERTEVEFEPRPVAVAGKSNDGLDAVYDIWNERYASGKDDVAARHNEHQP